MLKKYIILLFVIMLPLTGHAEDTKLQGIDSLPDPSIIRQKQTISIGEYHGEGMIDRVDKDFLVINDMAFYFGSSTSRESLNGSSSSTKLVTGLYVYYFLDSKDRLSRIIIEE